MGIGGTNNGLPQHPADKGLVRPDNRSFYINVRMPENKLLAGVHVVAFNGPHGMFAVTKGSDPVEAFVPCGDGETWVPAAPVTAYAVVNDAEDGREFAPLSREEEMAARIAALEARVTALDDPCATEAHS